MGGPMVIGIDPGANGGIAVLGLREAKVYKMPETERDLWDLLGGIKESANEEGREMFAFVEEIKALPHFMRGSVATLKLGVNYGGIRMALIGLGIPFETVRASTWQKAMKCLSKGDKKITKARAQELFPGVRVSHWSADALLVAEYGRRFLFSREIG